MIDLIKKKKKIIISVVIVFVLVLFFVLRSRKNELDTKVNPVKVQWGTLKELLTISGSVAADERVVLQFQTAGRLSYVGVKEGDYVNKYQLIARLDQRELQKRLQEDLNTFSKSRIDFDQGRADVKDVALTDAMNRTLDKNQLTLNNTILDVELRDISIQYSRLLTPIEGIVTTVQSPYPGVNIIPSSAQFEIINPNTIYFSALADQTEVTQLHEGMDGELTLDSFEGNKISGKVSKIAFTPKAGETGTVYAIKFTLNQNNNNSQYRVGMTGDLSFVTKEKKNVLYIPVTSISQDNGKSTVVIVENGKKVKKIVTTGMETDNDIEIVSGLKEGDVVYD